MQTYTEVTSSLGCSDCRSSFNSASLLLQHFAQHVFQEASGCQIKHGSILPPEDEAQCMQKHATMPHLQKKKTETILERVLKRNSALRHLTVTGRCEPGPSASNEDVRLFPTANSLSSQLPVSQTAGPDEACHVMSGCLEARVLKNRSTAGLDMLLEIGQRAKEKNNQSSLPIFSSSSSSSSSDVHLVRCDLQKRLENCISKLATTRKNGVMLENNKHFNKDITILSDTKKKTQLNCIKNKANSELIGNTGAIKIQECAKKNEELEDFNPLKFCFVTLEEHEDSVEHQKEELAEGSMVKSPRGASSRKQKSPKRVYYRQNGKLAHRSIASALSLDDGEKVVSSFTCKKKYPCHLCSKVFGWSTDLKRHILTHTGERPFKCSTCQATFTRNFLLQKHEKKIHNSCFMVSQESATSDLYEPSNKNQIQKDVKGGSEYCAMKHLMQCSDDSDEDRLVICDDGEKPNRAVPACSVRKLQNGDLHKIHPAKKRKEIQYKISSYEMFSHEALNIL
ncbi:hypothetical protein B7P43_G04068 [Cryptotermes secundus]|uniref:C2H2-type domain-containing protein n=1 Tax=Cryptotermes secundus TaxID=105785 RepID=A0A2J7QS84_9NEOP|nr:transcriptional repressor CTCFL [Cryptotermes secundus]XP_023709743.1 transcriptional repressor CTCFL [Cryptotermes secundus]XP_023709744.1 transcriptional repressor CTCFL [Cryptotermes secundus]XP_023709745.1 transcriptional repressor CTCFL [Cryptotermes secundus]XP_023709746.1 transcriptional repressor CTCFL [Cryptotermes secundus]PNF31436.1 hypothetical protein B7P43_G04068 [Cryptotermes secundus]PNF31437.1 hypothetical protein B7P43_G04068 [Cryptotermes secundus]